MCHLYSASTRQNFTCVFIIVIIVYFSCEFSMPRDRDPLVVGRVIGDVLDSFTRSISLRVTFATREVNNGCELKPSQVVNQPRVDIGGDDLRTFYTLVSLNLRFNFFLLFLFLICSCYPSSNSSSSLHLLIYLHME